MEEWGALEIIKTPDKFINLILTKLIHGKLLTLMKISFNMIQFMREILLSQLDQVSSLKKKRLELGHRQENTKYLFFNSSEALRRLQINMEKKFLKP
jgi:hypothetical protein